MQRIFCKKMDWDIIFFIYINFYIWNFLFTEASAQRSFWRKKFLHLQVLQQKTTNAALAKTTTTSTWEPWCTYPNAIHRRKPRKQSFACRLSPPEYLSNHYNPFCAIWDKNAMAVYATASEIVAPKLNLDLGQKKKIWTNSTCKKISFQITKNF